jgi:hypothetical protein
MQRWVSEVRYYAAAGVTRRAVERAHARERVRVLAIEEER